MIVTYTTREMVLHPTKIANYYPKKFVTEEQLLSLSFPENVNEKIKSALEDEIPEVKQMNSLYQTHKFRMVEYDNGMLAIQAEITNPKIGRVRFYESYTFRFYFFYILMILAMCYEIWEKQ